MADTIHIWNALTWHKSRDKYKSKMKRDSIKINIPQVQHHCTTEYCVINSAHLTVFITKLSSKVNQIGTANTKHLLQLLCGTPSISIQNWCEVRAGNGEYDSDTTVSVRSTFVNWGDGLIALDDTKLNYYTGHVQLSRLDDRDANFVLLRK